MLQLRRNKPQLKRGRPPQCNVTQEDVAKLKNLYLKTNRTRTTGSGILAARLLAQDGQLSPDVTAAILKPRAGNALPKCIVDAMHVGKALVQRKRNQKDARLRGVYVPGHLRMIRDADDTLRRLHPGERQSWDDATINLGVVVPWPWGGDKCADRYGVKIGRFQLLTCVDDATDFCPGFDYVIREQQSYKAEDVIAAQYRLWQKTYTPENLMLEGGSWQCNRAKNFHAAAGIPVEDATGRPNNKLIEGYFNRLWTVVSAAPGHVGRFRAEQADNNKLYLACRNGAKDPRKHFAALNDVLEVFSGAINYLNTTPMHSDKYGSWIPKEMHDAYLSEHPRPKATNELFYHAAPVVETRKVRRGAMVQVRCDSPFGEKFTYHFAEESLWRYEGRDVRIHFDPWSADLTAHITLVNEYKGTPAGSLLCVAACMEDAPQVQHHAESYTVDITNDGYQRALDMRTKVHAEIRRESRTIETTAKAAAATRKTVVRSKNLLQTIEGIQPGAEQQPQTEATTPTKEIKLPRLKRNAWQQDLAARLAEADEYDEAPSKRGEFITV